ncbi:hypothetical protein O181_114458 [Austropuccinia psidii MF-1]|uniref:Uncharacterized protein n=1 Tax=Austropuccinia psidii MF-1 TaxID=1389203 RepID=A0A9Q3PUK4_9BASI|nr:hypothetical protein [Austropuccinia psidii MF-1]
MPEPQRPDGGGAEGEASVSSVSLELMAKEWCSRIIQFFRINTPILKSSSMDQAQKPAMALNLGPKTFPAILGKVRFLWSWTLSMSPGHLGDKLFHGHFLWSCRPPGSLA